MYCYVLPLIVSAEELSDCKVSNFVEWIKDKCLHPSIPSLIGPLL